MKILEFTKSLPKPTEIDLDNFEHTNKIKLPDNYRDFLINHNAYDVYDKAGEVAEILYKNLDINISLNIMFFLPFDIQKNDEDQPSLQKTFQRNINHLGTQAKHYLPIACEEEDLLFAIGVKLGHENFGKIITFETFGNGNKEHSIRKVDESLEQFLDKLELYCY